MNVWITSIASIGFLLVVATPALGGDLLLLLFGVVVFKSRVNENGG